MSWQAIAFLFPITFTLIIPSDVSEKKKKAANIPSWSIVGLSQHSLDQQWPVSS